MKAYVILNSSKWRIVIICPSGYRTMLYNNYASEATAKTGLRILGFELIDEPKWHDNTKGVVTVEADL